jgi:sulfate/thiosulfate transport system ATP-binding protein
MAMLVRNATRRFGDFTALDDVSVEIPSGSLTALLGPSGSGKSTLLRVIAGLERPDAGSVEIDGRDATRLPPQRRGVGFVFQHYAAFKHMTVRENVAFGLKVARRPKAEVQDRVEELLELVQLPGLADRYPAQLSGGQRNAWPWPAPWPSSRACCCWTSRAGPWTPGSARSCGPGCATSTTRST